jgi:hypothetical protein
MRNVIILVFIVGFQIFCFSQRKGFFYFGISPSVTNYIISDQGRNPITLVFPEYGPKYKLNYQFGIGYRYTFSKYMNTSLELAYQKHGCDDYAYEILLQTELNYIDYRLRVPLMVEFTPTKRFGYNLGIGCDVIYDRDALDKNRIVVISPDRTYFSMFYALGLSYKLKDWNIYFRFNESITSDENLTDLILAKNMYYRSFDLGFQFRVF